MRLLAPFAGAVLLFGGVAAPSHAAPMAPQKPALTETSDGGVLDIRWTGRHVHGRNLGWSRGRHYGWARGRHYGWRHSRHRWR